MEDQIYYFSLFLTGSQDIFELPWSYFRFCRVCPTTKRALHLVLIKIGLMDSMTSEVNGISIVCFTHNNQSRKAKFICSALRDIHFLKESFSQAHPPFCVVSISIQPKTERHNNYLIIFRSYHQELNTTNLYKLLRML